LVLALSGCTETETTKNRDSVGFLKMHLNELLTLAALCHYKLAEQHVQSARFEQLPHLPKIPIAALANLDPLFEGIMRQEKTITTSSIVPRSFSDLIVNVLRVDEENQVSNNFCKLFFINSNFLG
jgi:hypothetical protein